MGLRRRLVFALVGLITITAVVVGVMSTVLAERTLRDRLIDSAVATTDFNLTVLGPAVGVAADATHQTIESTEILDRFLSRGPEGVRVEYPDGGIDGTGVAIPSQAISSQLREVVGRGEIGYQFTDINGDPYLLTGARLTAESPLFVFAESSAIIDDARTSLLITAAAVTLLAAVVASVAAIRISRRVLTPVTAASEAAGQLAEGDLSVRIREDADDELGRLNASFNTMADSLAKTIDELDQARRREQRFVADVSHELKTPLTGLVNEASLLRERIANNPHATEDERTLADLLNQDVARLRRLVDDLLEISRVELGGAIRPEPIDLRRFLAGLVASRLPSTPLRMEVEGSFVSDRRSLERIIGNLLDNARNHGHSKGVEVHAIGDADNVEITVSDRGPGVPDDQLTNLLAPFRSVDDARSSGSGLGLAIVSRHAARLGGEVTMTNRSGGGLCAKVRLPRIVAQPLHDGEDSETYGAHAQGSDSQGDLS